MNDKDADRLITGDLVCRGMLVTEQSCMSVYMPGDAADPARQKEVIAG